MPAENDTVQSTETAPAEVIENAEGEPSTVSDAPVEQPTETEAQKVDREAYEQLQKELNQAKQELNLRRNKEKELEQKRLEETGEWKEAYEAIKAEADARAAADREKEEKAQVEEFRKSVLAEYPEGVQDIAESLNLYWDDASDQAVAREQLKTKLDALAEKLGNTAAPTVHQNNPSLDDDAVDLTKLSATELRKVLPVAPDR